MRTVFIDVDTQRDFMLPSGALYVPGAEHIIGTVAELNRYAAARGIPLVSTADAHLENDEEFRRWPGHCIRGTQGQVKVAATLVGAPLLVPCSGDVRSFPAARQIVVEKQQNDVFSNPNFKPLLGVLDAEAYVVYGVVTEICVRFAAEGLLKTGCKVQLVTDAVRSLADADREQFLDAFQRSGGVLTTAREAMGGQQG